MNDKQGCGIENLIWPLIFGFIMAAGTIPGLAQYPYTIEMAQTMTGNATVVAKLEIVHTPGFEVTAGLEYEARIDPAFPGNGTAYIPPAVPGNQVVLPTANRNYIITKTPQIPGFIPGNSYNCSQVATDISYFDGLGRRLQDVSVMASPGQKDMIKPYSYDFAGRPDSNFIPYESANGQNGRYDASYAANQKDFIGSLFGESNKDYGFSKPLYEASPLNRILKQSAPGADWALKPNTPYQEHVAEMEYLVNETGVAGWKRGESDFSDITYGAGQLYITVTKNENENETGTNRSVTREYKDKSGQVVMVENQSGNSWNKTRYVYDDLGLLRCVVPPKATNPYASSGNSFYCYYYNYDNRHRMVEKKVPGAEWQYLIYDKRDRLVMSQDGKMRLEDPNKWVLNCYDTLNRQVMTGIYRHSSAMNRAQMQAHYDDHVTSLNESVNGTYDDTWHGYTRHVVDHLGPGNFYEVLAVNYYDNYNFAPANYHFDASNGIVPESEKLTNVKNLLTGAKVKVLSDDAALKNWMLSVTYYDDRYRVIQTIAGNPCAGGYDTLTTGYSFAGRIESQKTKHTAFAKTIEYTEHFVYDQRGRILEHTLEGLPGQPKVMMASLHYDQVGELNEKQIHAVANGESYQPFVQKTDYFYNIRGWLTAINDPENIASENDIFAMKLHYNDEGTGTCSKQYNGNIAWVNWATNRDQVRSIYNYSYDDLNRLTSGMYYQGNGGGYSHDGSFDEKDITYDANGNILTLNRYAANATPVDQLTYVYPGDKNQVRYILDPALDVPGVNDYPGGTVATQGFWYDNNGNMTVCYDKGLTVPVLYNHLNKPVLFDFGNGEKIRYIYDGAGNKLAKMVIAGNEQPESSMIYSGNFVYNRNGVLQYILTSEGRIVPDNDSYRFEYFMKDHLGNTRATFAEAAPGLPMVSEYQHYYPFGMQMEALCYSSGADLPNNHLYNGKELQPEYGLQWYDYGARFYDPQLGRWHSVDPLAEKWRRMTPYNYAANNPMRIIDPDGMNMTDFKDKEGNKILHVEDGSNAVFQLTGNNQTDEHFEFTGEFSDQKGKDEVNVEGAVAGAQDYVTNNYTKCNQSVNFVGRTYESATKAEGKTVDNIEIVSGNSLAKGITDNLASKVTPETSVASAQESSANGNLVVGANGNHVATMTTKTFNITRYNSSGSITGEQQIKGGKTVNVNGSYRPTNIGPGQLNSFQDPKFSGMIWYSFPAK